MFKDIKIKLGVLSIIGLMFLIIVVPSFSKPKTLEKFNDLVEWDGSIASGFASGTGAEDDPYIISDAKELAYLAESLKDNDYKDKYVKLSNDIIINKGILVRDGLKYIYNDSEYYIYGTKYYLTSEYSIEVGTLNILDSLNNFKGTFDGDYHTIFGLYLFGDDKALFTNLNGTLENLYVENAIVSSGYSQAGVVLNANESIISNIVFDGSVISNNESKNNSIINNLDDINVDDNYVLSVDKPINGEYTSRISGICSGEDTFTINGKEVECSSFNEEIDPFNGITFTGNVTLTNVIYELNYNKSISAGIIASAYNSSISNVINKGYISNYNSSGIVGFMYNTSLSNSYNKGIIEGNNASGLINTIYKTNDITYTNIFNVGVLNGVNNYGIINNVKDSLVTLNNSFNMSDVDPIKDIDSVNVINSYNKKYNVKFTLLEDNINSLYSDDNWIIREYPVLKYDSIKDNIAYLKVDDNTYYTMGNNNDIYKSEEADILLTYSNDYKPVREAYYYISNAYLTKEDLDSVEFVEYNNGIKLKDEGMYVIYIKCIDYNDNIYYINTDRYIIDYTPSNVRMFLGDKTYDDLSETSYIYVSKPLDLEIILNDEYNEVSSIEYYITDVIVNDIETIENNKWSTYNGVVTINNDSPYIVYVRVKNKNNLYNYINSDYIITKYFNVTNIKSGQDLEFNSNMSYNSSFNFDVELNHDNLIDSFDNYLKVDKDLPDNTKIILTDLVDNKVYYLVVNKSNSNGLYSFNSFKEVGKLTDNYFVSKDINERYNIYVSFEDILELNDNYTFEVIAKNSTYTINSNDSIKIYLNNVNVDLNSYLSINTNKNYLNINYNSNSETSIPLNIDVNNFEVINSNIEKLSKGIKIELYDDSNNIVSRDKYKNIKFEVDGNYYYPSSDNITYIDTESNNLNLIIHTSIDSLAENFDNYHFKVTSYLALKNVIKYESNNEVDINLVSRTSYLNTNYNFDVSVNNSLIINKEANNNLELSIKGKGRLVNPNIRLSLYKKKELTAYNQDYELVDLKDYVNEDFKKVSDNTYKVLDNLSYNLSEYTENNLSISFKDIEINGYRLLFELYDGDNLVGKKYVSIIVR